MRARCADCAHFRGGGAEVEAAFPGLSALSSGYASVRGGDGLCVQRDLYLPGDDGCALFDARRGGMVERGDVGVSALPPRNGRGPSLPPGGR